jgi:hypothetical protein
MRVIDISQEGIRKGTVFKQVDAEGEKGTFGIQITSPPGRVREVLFSVRLSDD